METGENQLADEYVQEFVLDHFEDVPVKREGCEERSGGGGLGMQVSCGGGGVQSPPHHLLTPPGHGGEEYMVAGGGHPGAAGGMLLHHQGGGVLVYPETPGTPPDTPPESDAPSPPPPLRGPYHQHHHHHELQQARILQPGGGPLVEPEMVWLTNGLRQEPLDLRPNCGAEEWAALGHSGAVVSAGKRLEYHPHHHHHLHHHHPSEPPPPLEPPPTPAPQPLRQPSTPRSSFSCPLSDEDIMHLSVREFNKRPQLNGFPREDFILLKQRKRNIQNCRSKLLRQRHELETTNRGLQQEIHRLKVENSRLTQ